MEHGRIARLVLLCNKIRELHLVSTSATVCSEVFSHGLSEASDETTGGLFFELANEVLLYFSDTFDPRYDTWLFIFDHSQLKLYSRFGEAYKDFVILAFRFGSTRDRVLYKNGTQELTLLDSDSRLDFILLKIVSHLRLFILF